MRSQNRPITSTGTTPTPPTCFQSTAWTPTTTLSESTTMRSPNPRIPVSWDEWKKINENLIVIVRSYNAQAIPLVAGFDWAYDLTPLRLSPIGAEGVGYVTHPYANKRPQPWEPKWEEDFGFAAAQYPIMATEFGGFGPSPQAAAGASAPPPADRK